MVAEPNQIRCGNSCSGISDSDFELLVQIAKDEVSARSWLVAVTDRFGRFASKFIPTPIEWAIGKAIEPILTTGNALVAYTHSDEDRTWAGWLVRPFSGLTFHKIAALSSGALGGSLGWITATGDVLLSTALVIRSIQEIAREYGEDLSQPEALAECLSVLAMGGPRADDDQLDSAFWKMRAGLKVGLTEKVVTKALDKSLKTEAGQRLLGSQPIKKIIESTAFQKVVERYGIASQAAFAGKAVPLIGALTGATINYQFISYYQKMAHVLYRIKALEVSYGAEQVSSCYMRVVAAVEKNTKYFDGIIGGPSRE